LDILIRSSKLSAPLDPEVQCCGHRSAFEKTGVHISSSTSDEKQSLPDILSNEDFPIGFFESLLLCGYSVYIARISSVSSGPMEDFIKNGPFQWSDQP
jgi:hypothetical protein